MKKVLLVTFFACFVISQAFAYAILKGRKNINAGGSDCRTAGNGCFCGGCPPSAGALVEFEGKGDYINENFTMTYEEGKIPAALKKNFQTDYYTCDVDQYIDDVGCTELKAPRGSFVPKGRFKITRKGTEFTINYGKLSCIFNGKDVPATKQAIGPTTIKAVDPATIKTGTVKLIRNNVNHFKTTPYEKNDLHFNGAVYSKR